MDTQVGGGHALEKGAGRIGGQLYGGANVLEWMAKHADTLNDWKVVGCAVVLYVLLRRVGQLVLWRPNCTRHDMLDHQEVEEVGPRADWIGAQGVDVMVGEKN